MTLNRGLYNYKCSRTTTLVCDPQMQVRRGIIKHPVAHSEVHVEYKCRQHAKNNEKMAVNNIKKFNAVIIRRTFWELLG